MKKEKKKLDHKSDKVAKEKENNTIFLAEDNYVEKEAYTP